MSNELLGHDYFKRLLGFVNKLMWIFAPLLVSFYAVQMGMLMARYPNLTRNFVGTLFAACTFNFGPRTITVPHLDFGNLSWGWCAITALGWFDLDVGGHLILWDLKLVIRFPPGSTIMIPSAICRHSNVPVGPEETRFSLTRYTAGGLFKWIRNSFKSDDDFARTVSREEKAARASEAATRWETDVAMYSTVDSLATDILNSE
ncbi:hypothetical protein B0H17DRAFT_1164779 [Mycena rosella]|uniref:Uncharacterized protein n=1 Tax=Mycena rosella TaxID=1033263 RepID=A0AAD7B9L8_MYCRO|nr:hypothetical protein B0H17DRAFT_1164779 [Mycena rosella]